MDETGVSPSQGSCRRTTHVLLCVGAGGGGSPVGEGLGGGAPADHRISMVQRRPNHNHFGGIIGEGEVDLEGFIVVGKGYSIGNSNNY